MERISIGSKSEVLQLDKKMRKVYAKEINECSCHFSSDIHSLIWAFEVCYFFKKKKKNLGNFLKVQWLGLGTFTAKSVCSIAGRGTKIPKATQQGQSFSLKNLYQYKTEGCALVITDSFGHNEVWDALWVVLRTTHFALLRKVGIGLGTITSLHIALLFNFLLWLVTNKVNIPWQIR